jgi:hypothetical protein
LDPSSTVCHLCHQTSPSLPFLIQHKTRGQSFLPGLLCRGERGKGGHPVLGLICSWSHMLFPGLRP